MKALAATALALGLTSAAWAGPGLIEAEVGLGDAETPPVLPEALASFGAARLGDWLYVYSGHKGPTHVHSFDTLSPAFRRLNLLDGRTWEDLPCPQRVQSAALVAHRETVIRVGGMHAENPRGAEREVLNSVDAVERFDPRTRAWSALPSLPEPRSSHGAAVVGDTLYVFGGWHLAPEGPKWLSDVLSLDLSAPDAAWSRLPLELPMRRAFATAALDGKLYLIGGMSDGHELLREVLILDPAHPDDLAAAPDLPFTGFGAAAVASGGALYASGLESALYRLDPDAEAWVPVATLAFPRYFHQLLELAPGRLLALGGVTRYGGPAYNEHTRTSEVLDTTRDGPRVSGWVLPYPGAAKNRQGVFFDRGSLYLFGGNDSLEQHDFAPENFLREGYRLRLSTLELTPVAPFPAARQSMRTLVLPAEDAQARGTGLAVGGFGHTGEGTRSWPEVHAYDFAADRWSPAPLSLPEGRTQFALAQHASGLYAFGGLDYDSERQEDFAFPTDVLVAKEGAFVPAGITLPRPRRAHGGALLGDRFYLAGGMREGFQLLEEVDVYDFATSSWSTIPSPPEPRISPHLIALGGKLYLLGGTTPRDGDSFTPNQRVDVYDPATKTWSTALEALPVSVRHMRFFPYGERILCVSTHTAGARAVRVLLFEP